MLGELEKYEKKNYIHIDLSGFEARLSKHRSPDTRLLLYPLAFGKVCFSSLQRLSVDG